MLFAEQVVVHQPGDESIQIVAQRLLVYLNKSDAVGTRCWTMDVLDAQRLVWEAQASQGPHTIQAWAQRAPPPKATSHFEAFGRLVVRRRSHAVTEQVEVG